MIGLVALVGGAVGRCLLPGASVALENRRPRICVNHRRRHDARGAAVTGARCHWGVHWPYASQPQPEATIHNPDRPLS